MKLAEILSGPETWCQGTLRDQQGRHCLIGALSVLHFPQSACRGYGFFMNTAEIGRLSRLIRELGWGSWPIALWNDCQSRTWEDVAALVEAYDRDRMLNP